MAKCQGTTKKGDRCKREALQDSQFCTTHADQELPEEAAPEGAAPERAAPERAAPESSATEGEDSPASCEDWNYETVMAVAVGFALVAVMLLLRPRK